jgi:hypothetical protein
MDADYYSELVVWLNEKWQNITFEHILYLILFSFILSYITEYILKFKEFRILYYTILIVLLIRLIE